LALASIGSTLLLSGVFGTVFFRKSEYPFFAYPEHWLVPLTITTAATFTWFYLWWWVIRRYKQLTATVMNHEDLSGTSLAEQAAPYYVDSQIFFYVVAVCLQTVTVAGLATYYGFGEHLRERVVTFLGLLLWPAAIILSAAIIARSLDRGRRQDDNRAARGAQELKNQILSLEVRADQANLPEADRRGITGDIRITSKVYQDLARLSPGAAIFLAWREVEEALRGAAQRSGVERSDRKMIVDLTNELRKRGLITEEVKSILTELRHVRNRAADSRSRILIPFDAVEYIRLARRVIAQLEQISAGTESTKDRLS
jgi:hypothetical protein